MSAPVLVLAWGNPSRGDDGLGPAFAAEVERRFGADIDVLVDYQLAPEHVLDLGGRRRVYFVDASTTGAPVQLAPVFAARDATFTSHALSPGALLYIAALVSPTTLPDCRLLAIRGERFGLGEPLSAVGRANLRRALGRFEADLGALTTCARL
ncbi:MAG: hydrogenase maturation protease [Myxococcaceae bacterium]|nr:hydrogenase maturation protease [Myxococcaceae bacterium]